MKRHDLLTWGGIAALVLVAGGLGWWIGLRVHAPEQPPPPGLVVVEPGQPLPPLSLPGLHDGAPRELSGPGRPRLLNYWASWCGPCREELPALDAFARAQAPNGVEVVGIALEDAAAARAFAGSLELGFVLLQEDPGPGDSSVRFGNARGLLPFSVLVGADGRLLKTHYGAFDDAADVADWAAGARSSD